MMIVPLGKLTLVQAECFQNLSEEKYVLVIC